MAPAPLSDEQAATIAGIVSGADGQCLTCAARLARDLERAWPAVDWAGLVAKAGEWPREAVAQAMS